MTLLDHMPHTCTARVRTRTRGTLGGSRDSWTNVFAGRACWQQAASDSEIEEFQKRGIVVTDKVYFPVDPGVDETHTLVITNPQVGSTDTFEVRSRAKPDASAGLGWVYRVMVEHKTGGGT